MKTNAVADLIIALQPKLQAVGLRLSSMTLTQRARSQSITLRLDASVPDPTDSPDVN